MKVTSITFMQTFPTGQYANQKLAVEIEIESPHPSTGESNWDAAMRGFEDAKELVNAAFHKMNPEIPSNPYPDSNPMNVTQVEKTPKEQAIDSQIEAIAGCTSLKSLEIFKKLVERENDPRLTEAYESKLKLLQ